MAEKKYRKWDVRNREIRALIAQYGIKYGEIAQEIHLSQSQLSQWMRNDLRDWQRQEILGAIVQIRLARGERHEEVNKTESDLRGYMGDSVERNMAVADAEVVGAVNG